jgi:hypothetical protein
MTTPAPSTSVLGSCRTPLTGLNGGQAMTRLLTSHFYMHPVWQLKVGE